MNAEELRREDVLERIDLRAYLIGAVAGGLPQVVADSILDLADKMVAAEARSNQLQVIERDRLARALHAAAGTHSRPRLTRQICPGPHMHEAEADAIIRALDSTTGDPE